MAKIESTIWDFKIVWNVVVWPKWQVVIPKILRDEMGIIPWDNLICISKEGKWIVLIKADTVLEFIDYVRSELEEVKNKTNNSKNKKNK